MMTFLGLFMLAGGGGLFWWAARQVALAGDIAATETSTAAQLAELAGEVGKEIGAGSFRQKAELKGLLKSDRPLTAKLSGQVCAAYVTTVHRKYEEVRHKKDQHGHDVHETHTGEEMVSEQHDETTCFVDDGSGRIELELTGADIDFKQVVNDFKPDVQSMPSSVAALLAHLALDGVGHGRKTIGYRYSERILPLERRVFVLGEASDDEGRLRVKKGKDGRMVVSLKSEEELVKGARSNATMARVAGVAVAIGGLVVLGMSLR